MENKPRKPWLAGLLSFFSIGLGHLYCGDIKKVIIFLTAFQIIFVLCAFSFLVYQPRGIIIGMIVGISYVIYCIADAVRHAKKVKHAYAMKRYNKWYFYLLYFVVTHFVIHAAVEATVKSNITRSYKIPSGAMMDTIQAGDYIMTDNFIYKFSEPKRGDIVTFPLPSDPSKTYIKRIVALGGDEVEIIDKKVSINGKILDEPYTIYGDTRIFPGDFNPRDNYGPLTIPNDTFFVLGDNRDSSLDSRFWGFVKKKTVEGKAMSIYWSWDRNANRVRWNRIGKIIN